MKGNEGYNVLILFGLMFFLTLGGITLVSTIIECGVYFGMVECAFYEFYGVAWAATVCLGIAVVGILGRIFNYIRGK